MTKERILELIKNKYINISNPQKKPKKELISKIVNEYKFRKEWSEYYDHDYYFEL